MSMLFHRRLGSSDGYEPPPGYTVRIWRPSLRRPAPRQCPSAYLAWHALHRTRVFKNRGLAAVLIFEGGRVVHRCGVFPPYFRFPFMADGDLQLGDLWTAPDRRGRGLARVAGRAALALSPGAAYWYLCDASNEPSRRLAGRLGFAIVGRGERTNRFGSRLLGAYQMQPPADRRAA